MMQSYRSLVAKVPKKTSNQTRISTPKVNSIKPSFQTSRPLSSLQCPPKTTSKRLVNGFSAKNSVVVNVRSNSGVAFEPEKRVEVEAFEVPESVLQVPRGANRVKLSLKVGDKLQGYEVKKTKYVEDKNLMVYELEHEATGAKHLHVECDDTENVFSMVLKTIPMNNKGTAHILEHLALCGSAKYPVRDPFFNMLKRSLSTYMNAWTGSDYTGYPFSTTNVKDYYNLMSVYLDSIFFPKLDYLDFLQEGHRLEINSETGKLEHLGVVYNEMKGAMSDSNDLFSHELSRELYPTTTYHYNSGGDPKAIRDIKHEELIKFHQEFYHPSNSFTMTYGDLPLEPHLEFISKNALNKFQRIKPNSNVADEARFTEPKRVTFKGPLSTLGDPQRQSKVAVSWLTNNISDIYEVFSMNILSYLLTVGPNSPFYKALISSNIGLSYSPGTGYDGSARETSFSVGLSDILESDIDRVENIIYETLEQVVKEGFSDERIESTLHQIEYGQKHVSSGFGLNLLSSASHLMIHGVSPADAIGVNEYIARLREDLKSGPFFQNLIKKHLLDNKHRLTFVMTPDPEYSSREQKDEEMSLTTLEETEYHPEHHKEARQRLDEEAQALEERQSIEDDVSILPKIKISEVDRNILKVPVTHVKVGSTNTDVQFADQPANGIAYLRASIDISDVPSDLLPYVPLFATTLCKVGAGPYNYNELAQKLELTTGSFTSSKKSCGHHTLPGHYDLRLGLYSASLRKNIDSMFDSWQHVLSSPKFEDKERLKTLIGNIHASMQSSMVDSGHTYASSLAASTLIGRSQIEELWGGVAQFNFIKDIHQSGRMEEVSSKLKSLASFILDPSKIKFAVNSEKQDFDIMEKRISKLISVFDGPQRPLVTALPHERLGNTPLIQHQDPSKNTYFALQSQVNYVTKVYKSVPYNSEDYSKLDILGLVMAPNFLHKEIREKGGAYGSGLSNGGGSLTFYSYRDPNVEETLESFQKGIDWILKGEFTEEHIEEAKLQLISNLDSPQTPSTKGLRYFESSITDEMYQLRRDRIFEVNRDDIIEVCQKYLVGTQNEPVPSAIAVFGSDQNERFQKSSDWIYRQK